MNVTELIEALSDLPGELEVVLALVEQDEDEAELLVEQFSIDQVVPFEADDDEPAQVWLVSGDEDDVAAFVQALDDAEDDEDDDDDDDEDEDDDDGDDDDDPEAVTSPPA